MKESKLLGTIKDFEEEPFDVELFPKDSVESQFMKARFSSANEWLLDIDYDRLKDTDLEDG